MSPVSPDGSPKGTTNADENDGDGDKRLLKGSQAEFIDYLAVGLSDWTV